MEKYYSVASVFNCEHFKSMGTPTHSKDENSTLDEHSSGTSAPLFFHDPSGIYVATNTASCASLSPTASISTKSTYYNLFSPSSATYQSATTHQMNSSDTVIVMEEISSDKSFNIEDEEDDYVEAFEHNTFGLDEDKIRAKSNVSKRSSSAYELVSETRLV